MRSLKFFAALIGMLAIFAAVGHAYATYGNWAGTTVSFYVNPANGDVSESAATTAVQAGMDAWSTQAGTPFRYNYAGRVSDTTTGYDQRNVMIFRNAASDSGSGIIATTYWWTLSGKVVDADIIFWDGSWKFFTGTSGCSGGAYIEDVATHELGHALGLLHTSVSGSTMNSGYSTCSQALRTLGTDDIAGAQALYGSATGPTNTAPSVTISSPGNGATVSGGTSLSFSGSASDTQDGSLSSALVWRSSIDGQIGTGASFSRTLTGGTHTITASVSDSGSLTTQKSISVTVGSATTNTAPSVTISSPTNGASYAAGASVTFTGSASDTQDGNLTSTIVWRSSIDGQLGTGGSLTRTLTAGTHTITATVSDSGALTAQKSVSITVASSTQTQNSTSPTLSVRAYKVKGVQTADLTWANVTATSVDVYRNGSKIKTVSNTGTVTDRIGQKGAGSYSYQVCATGTSSCSNQVTASF